MAGVSAQECYPLVQILVSTHKLEHHKSHTAKPWLSKQGVPQLLLHLLFAAQSVLYSDQLGALCICLGYEVEGSVRMLTVLSFINKATI